MLPQIDRHDHFYIQHVPPELQPYLHKVVERKKKEDYLEAQSIVKFSDDEIAEYKRRFKEFDADASGGIDIHELSRLMASIEPDPAKRLSQEKLDELMDEVGTRELPRAAPRSLPLALGDEAERARPRRRSALAVPLARSTSTAAARSTSTSSSSSSTSGGATRTAASARCVRSRALAITRRARASLSGMYIYM